MSGSLKEFDKWYLPDKDIYTNEYEMQKRAWRAALEMVQDWYKGAREGFDLGLWDMLKKELEGADK